MAPKIRVKRQPSAYNTFMNKRLTVIKCEDPTSDHKKAFKMAAHEWKDSPENPFNKKNSDDESEEKSLKKKVTKQNDDSDLDGEKSKKNVDKS